MYKRTFKEYLIDLLNETTLFEMAYDRKKAYQIVNNYQENLMAHLIKLKVLDLPKAHNHWIKEINSNLLEYRKIKLKPKSNQIPGDLLIKWFFEDSGEYDSNSVDNYVLLWKEEQYKDVKLLKYNSDTVIKDIKEILINVFNDIGDNKFISIRSYL